MKNSKDLLRDHLRKYGKQGRTCLAIAEQLNYLPNKTDRQRADSVKHIWRQIRKEGNRYKSLFPRPAIDEIKVEDGTITTIDLAQVPEKFAKEYMDFIKWKQDQEKLVPQIKLRDLPSPYIGNKDNILIIGDIHEPFCLDGYLEFCREQQERFDCGRVVFIGDIIDSYYESFYEKAIDAPMTQQQERQAAIAKLKEWYHVFPEAVVTVGNHTLRYYRKGTKYGIHESHFRPLDQILEAPKDWRFVDEIIIDKVLYRHGATGHAFTNAQKERMSVVEGDKHTLGYVQWSSSRKDSIFGMQTGCGIDYRKFAFHYAKNTSKKPVIGCGVVLDRGQTPLFLKMKVE